MKNNPQETQYLEVEKPDISFVTPKKIVYYNLTKDEIDNLKEKSLLFDLFLALFSLFLGLSLSSNNNDNDVIYFLISIIFFILTIIYGIMSFRIKANITNQKEQN